jgi:hypothetical protein
VCGGRERLSLNYRRYIGNNFCTALIFTPTLTDSNPGNTNRK